jgi:hypothetical protein
MNRAVHGLRAALLAFAAVTLASCGDTGPDAPFVDFVVAVDDQTFVLRVSDPETIAAGYANLRGRDSRFPSGPIRRGDGGFNAPWSWHLDSAETRFVEAAIEVCDGEPRYVEGHVADYLQVGGYCPWAARVVAVKP